MSRRKGLSQVLALIVAASVLMMTALTLIFMTQGGLEDVFQSSGESSCVNSVQSACQFDTGGEHSTPASCERAGKDEVEIDNQQVTVTGNTFTCPQ